MNPYDRISSCVLTGVGVVIIVVSSRLSLGSWHRPGPAFIPLLSGVIIVVLSLVVFFQAWLWGRKKERKAEILWTNGDLKKVLLTLASLLAYGLLISRLGYLTTTFFFIFLLPQLIAHIRCYTALVEAAATTSFSYILFELWLKTPLPKGLWGF